MYCKKTPQNNAAAWEQVMVDAGEPEGAGQKEGTGNAGTSGTVCDAGPFSPSLSVHASSNVTPAQNSH